MKYSRRKQRGGSAKEDLETNFNQNEKNTQNTDTYAIHIINNSSPVEFKNIASNKTSISFNIKLFVDEQYSQTLKLEDGYYISNPVTIDVGPFVDTYNGHEGTKKKQITEDKLDSKFTSPDRDVKSYILFTIYKLNDLNKFITFTKVDSQNLAI